MADIEHGGSGKPWWETAEIRRLTEVTEAQSRAIEALRQRNIELRQQQRGAVARERAWWDAYEDFERTGSMAALNRMGEAARRAAAGGR